VEEEMGGAAEVEMVWGRAAEVEWAAAVEEEEMEMGVRMTG
jgi:hypothetical protein